MPQHNENDRHKPPTGAALFPAIFMEQRAGPLAYAISSGCLMRITESAQVELRSTRITDLDQNTIEIVAEDHSEDDAEQVQGQLVGKVASITMDVVLHWESGAVQPAILQASTFADWNDRHAVLVWITNEPLGPEEMREFIRESIGDVPEVQKLYDLVEAALRPEWTEYEFEFPGREGNRLPELANLQEDYSVSNTVYFRGNEAQATRIAKALYGEENAAEMVRMALASDVVSPEFMHDDLQELARLHSEETGVDWVPLPAAEIDLELFVRLLGLANAGYLESQGQSFNLTPAAARAQAIDFELALRRR